MEQDNWPPQGEGRDTSSHNVEGEVVDPEVIVDGLYYQVLQTETGLIAVNYKYHEVEDTKKPLHTRQEFFERVRAAHTAWSGDEAMGQLTPTIIATYQEKGVDKGVLLNLGMPIDYVLGDDPKGHNLLLRNQDGAPSVVNPVATLFAILESAVFEVGQYPDLACITEANIVVGPQGNPMLLVCMVDPELTKEEFETFLKHEKTRWQQIYVQRTRSRYINE